MTYSDRVTASLHKLTAGDGYTYLTRQVAVTDSTERGRVRLSDYYTEKGERPGRWVGSGLAGLGSVAVGDTVTEAQMRALFGEGRHPDADRLQETAIASGGSVKAALKASQLGRAYAVSSAEPTSFLVETRRRYQAYNAARGLRVNAPVPEDERARIRSEVGRATFEAMHGRAPLDEQELTSHITRQSRRSPQAVAGFDVTFTPVKSVSALWAIAPLAVAEQIEAAHDAAVDHALRWLEQEVAHTRRGAQGLRQAEVTGILAAAFTHRDSRNGDPNLHTHVAIANKVQDRDDGAWLALDGAALYRAMVTVSEHYNSHLEAELGLRLGVEFSAKEVRPDRRPIRELVGVPAQLLEAWSSRRAQIEAETDRLATGFQHDHGRAPTGLEMIELAQQANLATRQAKHEPRSLAEQRAAWRAQAEGVLGAAEQVDTVAEVARRRRGERVATASPDVLDRVAAAALATVSQARARWQPTHVMAEAYRRLRILDLPPEAIDPAVRAVTDHVLAAAIPLDRPDDIAVPEVMRRSDGTSVYEPKHTRLYTTASVVDAEERIVALALRRDGRTVDDKTLSLAFLEAEANGRPLNPGQVELVRALSMSGQRVQLAIAPAGSGKTTAMETLARAWTEAGGNVVGLAPSAVAADELRAAVPDGVVDTLAQLAYALNPPPDKPMLPLPGWAERIGEGSLVLVDEAGMAGTSELASVIDYVVERGGSVRLIGDDRQLAAVGAGGVLRDVQEAAGIVTLTELMRFNDNAEAAATLAVRDGDPAAVGFYLDRGRLHDAGDPTTAIVDAWHADTGAGRDALMVAGTRETVTALNEQARGRRIALGLVDHVGPAVRLRNGLAASVGDHILTRHNDRRNRLSATDFVKNGDRWTVLDVDEQGSLKVQHQRSGRITRLGADYVSRHVDHAYAVTVHSAQGSTVDVCHVLVEGGEDRQMLYVALSRGRSGNHVWLRSGGDGDPHSVIRPEVVRPSSAGEVVAQILRRDGREASAATTRRLAESPQELLRMHASRYLDGVMAAAEDLAGPDRLRAIDEHAEESQPGITSSGGWLQLRTTLAILAAGGEDPVAALDRAAQVRAFTEVDDIAAVLNRRLSAGAGAGRPGPLPWLPAIPAPVADHQTWGPYLAQRAEQLQHYAGRVADQALLTTQPPRWAEPVADHSQLRRDLAVWRAAAGIDDADPAPAGQPFPASRERAYQRILEARVDAHAGPRFPLSAAVVDLLQEREPGVLADPYWPVVARRLSAAAHRGADVDQLVAAALDQSGPLPEEQPAAALWFRLAGELHLTVAAADADTRLRPDWTDELLRRVPDRVGNRILTDPQWPDLVAEVADAAARTGLPAAAILDHAVAATNFGDLDTGGIPADAAAAVLIWRLNDLSAPEPLDRDAEPPDPEDPAHDRPDDLDALLAGDPDAGDGHATLDSDTAGNEPATDAYLDDVDDADVGRIGVVETVDRARLVALNTAAAEWWAQRYTGSPAARYIADRLGDDLTGDPRLTVGYAPAGWTQLVDQLRASHRASDHELVDAGLAKWSRRGTLIDLMRDRVVFGIHDQAGDLVGFTGRAAPGADPTSPKWLNTPATPIFTKGELLYGYAEHRDLLAAGATPVRVEGVLDAIAITHASGGRAVGLAPLGTALTAAQADTLKAAAHGGPLLHATDNDPAGLKAAARDYTLLTVRGLDLRQLVLTDGQHSFNDPADTYHNDPAALTAALNAVDIAPPLTGLLIGDTIRRNQDRITDNLFAAVAVSRDIGALIAAAPPTQWEDLVAGSASILADIDPLSDTTAYRELITTATVDGAENWAPYQRHLVQTPSTASDPASLSSATLVHERLKSIAATLAAARERDTRDAPTLPPDRRDQHQRHDPEQHHDEPGHGRDL